ncbi:hypothetical protein COY07_01455 [Candidatus Peregrinibacteria bacterium CG_4_10_14_0_2_um_filter_43_11]|nr:MAG: hypothetical protein COY07_01455 [Candidatus Peregrinibacteria bacterium CG_4_10_14_0_2_um_filter_43_11]
MIFSKKSAIFVTLMVSIMLLNACGKATDSTPSEPTEGTETSSSTTPETVPAKVSATAVKSLDCYPTLQATESEKPRGAKLSWTQCDNDDFQVYKVLRSVTNPDPQNMESNVVYSTSERGATSMVDGNLSSPETYHYKICVQSRVADFSCSKAVSIDYTE